MTKRDICLLCLGTQKIKIFFFISMLISETKPMVNHLRYKKRNVGYSSVEEALIDTLISVRYISYFMSKKANYKRIWYFRTVSECAAFCLLLDPCTSYLHNKTNETCTRLDGSNLVGVAETSDENKFVELLISIEHSPGFVHKNIENQSKC